MPLVYEKLGPTHTPLLQSFCCSEPSFAEYLKRDALKDSLNNMNTTVLALEDGVVVGYFGYCSRSISKKEFTRADQKGLPGYPIPAILLTRLAVDQKYTGTGIGSDLLVEFFSIVDGLNKKNPYSPAARIVFLDLYKPSLAAFYQKLGFKLTRNGKRMYLSMTTIAGCLPGGIPPRPPPSS